MPQVLEEITESEITKEHVESRVGDWRRRIDALYAQIESWLPEGYSVQKPQTILMHEEMMQKFAVPSQWLPVLEIYCGGVRVANIEPRALWIVGANGRLDMVIGSKQFIIVDTAENFASPVWSLTPFSDRRNRQPLTRQTFCSFL